MTVIPQLTRYCGLLLLSAAVVAPPRRLPADDSARFAITGKVIDEDGKPIAGALVRAGFRDTVCRTTSGPDGVYRLADCDRRATKIVVSASGRALELREIRAQPGMSPVNIQMSPGGLLRVRILDEKGNPVPGARLVFRRWLGSDADFAFDHVQIVGNKEGIWEWREAPLDVVTADIVCPGRTTFPVQSLVARAAEYVIRPSPTFIVTGRVVDRETKQPVNQFLVVPGFLEGSNLAHWVRRHRFASSKGRYEFKSLRDELYSMVLRIEADGYLPAVSRAFLREGDNLVIDFELNKGEDINGQVLTPDGRPASHAAVALGPNLKINIVNCDLQLQDADTDTREADDSGRFHFAPPDGEFYIAIVHPTGYVFFKPIPRSMRRIIQLDPWARVEGTYRVNGKPLANVALKIEPWNRPCCLPGDPEIYWQQRATTGPDGHFVFEHVLGGLGAVGRRVFVIENGAQRESTELSATNVAFHCGKTLRLDMAERGRCIVGKLRPYLGFKGDPSWPTVSLDLELDQSEDLPSPRWTFPVNGDGSFRTDYVPAGEYRIAFHIGKPGMGRLAPRMVSISTAENEHTGTPVDLGVLTLEKD
jgi:Carboxypeptidase regulatory-like domain